MLKPVTIIEEARPLFRETAYPGIYYVESFNSSFYIKEPLKYLYKLDENFSTPYGVCDEPEDIFSYYDFNEDVRDIVIFMTEIRKEDQPAEGGWRWEKWGEYWGNQNRQCDYLYDEPEVERVYVWEAWEIGEIKP